LKVYRNILQVWHLKNEAFDEKCNKMLSIDSQQSLYVGQWTSSKESAQTSSDHRRSFRSMSSFQEDFDKAFSSTGDEKQLTRTFSRLSLDELSSQREASKSDWRLSTDSIIRYELRNSYSSSRSELYDTDGYNKHITKDPNMIDELNIKVATYREERNSNLSESFYEAFDKVWPRTPESSTPSIYLTSTVDGGHISTNTWGENILQGEPNHVSLENRSHGQFDKMYRLLPRKEDSSSSNSESIIRFNIEDSTDDGELTPLECDEDEVIFDLSNFLKDRSMEDHERRFPKKSQNF